VHHIGSAAVSPRLVEEARSAAQVGPRTHPSTSHPVGRGSLVPRGDVASRVSGRGSQPPKALSLSGRPLHREDVREVH